MHGLVIAFIYANKCVENAFYLNTNSNKGVEYASYLISPLKQRLIDLITTSIKPAVAVDSATFPS